MADGTGTGLPAPARALLAWLREQPETPRLADMAAEFGVSDRTVRYWLADLLAVGAVISEGQKRARVLRVNTAQMCRIRTSEDGRRYRCRRCRALNPRWNTVCARCNQATRGDRAWKSRAVQVAREFKRAGREVLPITVQGILRRKYDLHVPLWDRPTGANDQPAAGLVTCLLEAGMIGEEWRRRQRAALSSESWVEDMTP